MHRSNKCKELPPVEYLRQCFDYDPETGSLKWSRTRPKDHFQTESKWKKYMTERAGKEAGCRCRNKDGKKLYVQTLLCNLADRRLVRSMIMVHRICASLAGLNVTTDLMVDHIDGDVWNHAASNLRLATVSQNSQNCRRHRDRKSSLPKGVIRQKGENGYRASISLGTFPTAELAHAKYCEIARLLHGEFARFD